MQNIHQLAKFLTIKAYIAGYFVNLCGISSAHLGQPMQRRKSILPAQRAWIKKALDLLNIEIEFKGPPPDPNKNYLFVSNHLSYLDILVLYSQIESCFVTSMEIKNTIGLGQLTDIGGCLYVERRNRNNLHNEIDEIVEALEYGMNVTIFPEATSTNGEQVLRFRRPLYNAAIKSKRYVKPLCINYKEIDGEPLTKKNRDRIFWYGEMAFLPHLWQLMRTKSIKVEVEYLEDIPTMEMIEASDLAEKSHQLVSSSFCPVLI